MSSLNAGQKNCVPGQFMFNDQKNMPKKDLPKEKEIVVIEKTSEMFKM